MSSNIIHYVVNLMTTKVSQIIIINIMVLMKCVEIIV